MLFCTFLIYRVGFSSIIPIFTDFKTLTNISCFSQQFLKRMQMYCSFMRVITTEPFFFPFSKPSRNSSNSTAQIQYSLIS